MKISSNAAVGGNVAQLRIRIAQLMGADLDKMLAHLCIDMEALESPELYLDAEFDNRVWQAIEQQTGNDLVGASMGAYFQLASMGLVGKAIMACETIHQGLCSYVRYSKLLPLRDKVDLIEQDQQLLFQVSLSNPLLPYSHHSISSFLAFVLTSLEQLSGQRIPVKQMGFVFDAPEDPDKLARYRSLFNTESVLFSQKTSWFSLDRRHIDIKNLASNRSEFDVVDQLISQQATSEEGVVSSDFCRQVKEYIRQNLGKTEVSLARIAKHFSMSERKFQNELSRRQQNYSKLLSSVRRDYSLELIHGASLSVSDMAYLLGYQDINSFSRHFKKWYGISVSEYRKGKSLQ
ncbi:MAG: AraC family transcriptional regulator ligand-binding domain-containing protein [Cellvibrionaceae bacterium]